MSIQHSRIEYLAEYAQHLKNLSDEDRYTRFGYAASLQSIDQMILNIVYNQANHHIFTYYIDGKIAGFGHLAREDTDWELAVSVEREYQGRGVADELMSHMIAWGKTHGVEVVYMHCITENQKIQHLARKHGLRAWERVGHELTARVQLPEPTVFDYTTNFVREQSELASDIVKLQRAWLRNWTGTSNDHSN
jgi:GNAT superfamily N-acetyltransferase